MFETVKKLATKSQQDFDVTECYIDNEGLYRCKNCHDRRQFDISFMGTTTRVFGLCKCKYEQVLSQRAELNKTNKIQDFKRYGFSNEDFGNHSFSEDDCPNSQESQIARKYVQNFEIMKQSNLGLLFYGECDTGKSFYCSCICKELTNQGYFVIMTSLSTLAETMEHDYRAEYFTVLERVRCADLLILDDVGTEKKTQSMLDDIFAIVNARYVAKKPMIISTNLETNELCTGDLKLQRIYQRIMSNTKKIKCTNPSHRKGLCAEQTKALKLLN